MLLLTPEIEEVFRWFAETHEIAMDGMSGRAWWRLARLPGSGGAGDQDARLMASLEYVRNLRNELLMEQQATHAKREEPE